MLKPFTGIPLKRLLLAMYLLLSSGPGYGGEKPKSEHQWTGPVELYGRASLPGDVKLYIDLSTFRHHNNLVTMFNLFDFVTSPKPRFGSAPYFSERELREYDCANKRYRTVEGKRYFDQMGTGKIVDVWHEKDWVEILHDTGEPTDPSEALWRLACALKPIIGQPAPYKDPHIGG